ncbi:MAG: class I SAM-dependent methyltransferase [Centipeda sp. (in: firmicutes)]
MAEADWQKLDRETAEGNPRRPEGEAGRAMLARMNESHAQLVEWGLAQIDLRAGDTVLDIGCGGGNTLARMAQRVTEGHLVGIDYAETSVEASRAFNAGLIEAGRMEILHGSVEHLPFADGQFDAVVTVESFYFWPSPEESLKEAARVIRRGGTFLLLAEIYGRDDLPEGIRAKIAGYDLTNPTPEEFERLFRAAGFSDVTMDFKAGEYWIAVRGVR